MFAVLFYGVLIAGLKWLYFLHHSATKYGNMLLQDMPNWQVTVTPQSIMYKHKESNIEWSFADIVNYGYDNVLYFLWRMGRGIPSDASKHPCFSTWLQRKTNQTFEDVPNLAFTLQSSWGRVMSTHLSHFNQFILIIVTIIIIVSTYYSRLSLSFTPSLMKN